MLAIQENLCGCISSISSPLIIAATIRKNETSPALLLALGLSRIAISCCLQLQLVVMERNALPHQIILERYAWSSV